MLQLLVETNRNQWVSLLVQDWRGSRVLLGSKNCLLSFLLHYSFHVTWFCLWKCIFVLYHGLFFYGVTNQVQLKELYNFNQPVACFEKIQSSRGTKFIVYSDSFSEVWMFLTVLSWLYLQWNRYSIFDRSSS